MTSSHLFSSLKDSAASSSQYVFVFPVGILSQVGKGPFAVVMRVLGRTSANADTGKGVSSYANVHNMVTFDHTSKLSVYSSHRAWLQSMSVDAEQITIQMQKR